MANRHPIQRPGRRRELALTEIDALAVNLIHDARALERKLIALAPGLAVAAYADLRLIEAGADCIRSETREAAPPLSLTSTRPAA